jgi:hypothetical protein
MADDPIPSILAAVYQVRDRRGWKDPEGWTRPRAQLLAFLYLGQPLVWLEGVRELPVDQRTRLIGEACDAVLRSGRSSHEADVVCRELWRRWCRLRDGEACERVRRMTDVRS